MRPAPIAVNWFGFPGSMGTPYHHYIIADARIIPPGDELYYSETVLRLPCYQPNDRKRRVTTPRPTRAEAGLSEDSFVFCCLNGMQKLTAAIFDCWMTILDQVPGSILWLLSGTDATNARLRANAESQGIDPARLVFAPKMANPDHLARMALADLFLDTFPYGAHTTASDALWMGLPVLTLEGRSFASRVCASLVAAAGSPELICRSTEDYSDRAIALATERTELAAIRARLAQTRLTSALFDTPALVSALETLFHQMQQSRLSGNLPQPDLANLEIYHEIGPVTEPGSPGSLTDAAYKDRYRERLMEVHGAYPIRPDTRLWKA